MASEYIPPGWARWSVRKDTGSGTMVLMGYTRDLESAEKLMDAIGAGDGLGCVAERLERGVLRWKGRAA
jgi:hypothetical protein